MLIAESLQLIKSKKSQLAQLEDQIIEGFHYVKDEEKPYDFNVIIDQHRLLAAEIDKLQLQLANTNISVFDESGTSLFELINKYESTKALVNVLGKCLAARTERLFYREENVKQTTVVNKAEVRARMAVLEKMRLALNAKIQQINWNTELAQSK